MYDEHPRFTALIVAGTIVAVTGMIVGYLYLSKRQDQQRVTQLIQAIDTATDQKIKEDLSDQLYLLEAHTGITGMQSDAYLHEQMIVRQLLRAQAQNHTESGK